MRPDHFAGFLAAWLLAALVPAAIGSVLFEGEVGAIYLSFLIALGHVLLLAFPIYRYFSARQRVNAVTCAAMGAAIAAGPVGLLSLLSFGSLQSASTGGIPTVVDGVPTLAGILQHIAMLAAFGAIGAAAGLSFWLTLRLSGAYGRDGVPAPRDFVFEPPLMLARRPGMILGAGTAIAALLVVMLPTITKDRSCHNLFRDGRNSIGPELIMELRVDEGELTAIAGVIEALGREHQMSVRQASRPGPTDSAFRMSLCREPGLVVVLSHGFPTAVAPMSISVYISDPSITWHPVARDISTVMQQRWAGAFKVSKGRIPTP